MQDASAPSDRPATPASGLTFRSAPVPADAERVRAIVDGTGFFSAEESAVAVELVDDRLERGEASDYRFVFAELADPAGRRQVVGYSCFGRIPMTRESWDLYWIAVDATIQGLGLGRAVLRESERRIADLGGRRVYVETSSRPQYAPTRAFYERCDYEVAAVLNDFYAPGDGKVIFLKVLAGPAETG
jgi:ribosomal protein S18 acetylase RimI-like enzyme